MSPDDGVVQELMFENLLDLLESQQVLLLISLSDFLHGVDIFSLVLEGDC